MSYKKVFSVDSGITSVVASWKEMGNLLENLVFVEILRRLNYSMRRYEIYYYETKSGKEIDFFVISNGEKKLIEVTYEVDEKHIEKVKEAMKELKIRNAKIISWEDEEEVKGIKIIPVWKWLLEKDFAI